MNFFSTPQYADDASSVKRSPREIDDFSLKTGHAIDFSSAVLRREREERRRIPWRACQDSREWIGGSGRTEDGSGILDHVLRIDGENPNDVMLLQNLLRDAEICRQKKTGAGCDVAQAFARTSGDRRLARPITNGR